MQKCVTKYAYVRRTHAKRRLSSDEIRERGSLSTTGTRYEIDVVTHYLVSHLHAAYIHCVLVGLHY